MSEYSKIEGAVRAENRARAAAELVLGAELLPGPVPLPDFASLMAERARWRRRGLTLSAVAALGAVVLGSVWMLRERAPISYVVDGTVAIADGVIDAAGAPGNASASVRFSEGTEIGLSPGARLRVVGRTARGAALALDRGRARFAVTHRSGAHWSVASGPFTVDVVGTKFSLDWSPRDERLVVDLTSGSVQIRGASVGGPVAMHPGERLIATAADRRVTLLPLVEAQRNSTTGSSDPADIRSDSRSDIESDLRPGASPPVPEVSAPPARSLRRAMRRSQLALASPTRTPSSSSSSASSSGSTPISAPVSPPARAPEPPPLAPPRAEAQPPRFVPPVAPAPSMTLAAGGGACGREGAQYRFERMESGILLPDFYTLAFSSPRTDHSHSWCGQASLRLDATFNEAGRRNFFGRFARETGQVMLKLRRPTDLTRRTVTIHFFVDGPADARFTAELVVVNRGRWVSGPASGQMAPGRWWTISHRFDADNEAGVPGSSNPGPFPVGGTSPVTETDRLGLAIHSTGGRRVWTGAVYVDDVGWK